LLLVHISSGSLGLSLLLLYISLSCFHLLLSGCNLSNCCLGNLGLCNCCGFLCCGFSLGNCTFIPASHGFLEGSFSLLGGSNSSISLSLLLVCASCCGISLSLLLVCVSGSGLCFGILRLCGCLSGLGLLLCSIGNSFICLCSLLSCNRLSSLCFSSLGLCNCCGFLCYGLSLGNCTFISTCLGFLKSSFSLNGGSSSSLSLSLLSIGGSCGSLGLLLLLLGNSRGFGGFGFLCCLLLSSNSCSCLGLDLCLGSSLGFLLSHVLLHLSSGDYGFCIHSSWSCSLKSSTFGKGHDCFLHAHRNMEVEPSPEVTVVHHLHEFDKLEDTVLVLVIGINEFLDLLLYHFHSGGFEECCQDLAQLFIVDLARTVGVYFGKGGLELLEDGWRGLRCEAILVCEDKQVLLV